jgi:feruloyl esterase
MFARWVAALASMLALALAFPAAATAATCESLVVNLALTGTTVTAAATVPGPSYTAPDGITYTNVPSFCKVSAVLVPTSDSFINVELWMPTSGWNGKFEGIGNGGYAGTIALGVPAMIAGLQSGFAVATTDMGTAPSTNNDGDALIGHPQKWIDFGWRATHLMTTTSKQLIQTYYGQEPRWSYFNGCSTGGEQALMSAQRFPDDYDGILGGDPAANRTHVHVGVLWNYSAMHKTPGSLFTSTGQTQAMVNSILAACVVKSGGLASDPFLTDPRTCDWDPSVMQCTGAPDGTCLTADQVAAARAMYAGAVDPVSGHRILPGSVKGSEADGQFGWVGIGTQPETPFGSLFKWVFGPAFVYSMFNYDGDMATMDSILAPNLNANSTNLSTFRDHGHKLVMYHGWADPLVTPQESINHYNAIVAAQGSGAAAVRKAQNFYRLFMVPGMYHCATGPGPNAFGNRFSGIVYAPPPLANDAAHDIFVALQDWVEKGVAPTKVVAAKYVNDVPQSGVAMTRPICLYPNVAKYSGAGDPNDAANFSCAPAPGMNDPNQVAAPEYLN